MQTVLLGRTLRRQLTNVNFDASQAAMMRQAFDDSFARMDFRAVQAAITDAVRSVRSWKSSAVDSARRLSSQRPDSDTELPKNEQVDTTAAKVTEVLDRPETAQLFEEFDRRFDTAFAKLKSAAINTAE